MSDASKESAAGASDGVTVVTQTRVRLEQDKAFAEWQDGTSSTIARFPGFLHQSVMPPSPPAQVDWVILQRFVNIEFGHRLAALGGAAGAAGWRATDAGRPGRCPPGARRHARRATRPGVGGDLDLDQAGQRAGISGLGAAHRRGANQSAGLSGLSLRAADPRRAGRLAVGVALRQRSEPGEVARFAGTAAADRRRQALHRGFPYPGGAHRFRAMVPIAGGQATAGCLEAEHDRARFCSTRSCSCSASSFRRRCCPAGWACRSRSRCSRATW